MKSRGTFIEDHQAENLRESIGDRLFSWLERRTGGKPMEQCRVVARTCPCCGHHEIGTEGPGGEFRALRPGDVVLREE